VSFSERAFLFVFYLVVFAVLSGVAIWLASQLALETGVASGVAVVSGFVAAAGLTLVLFRLQMRGRRIRAEELRRKVVEVELRQPTPRAAPAPIASQDPRPLGEFKPADVFISYKRQERSEIGAIAERLGELKLRVWFDADMRSGSAFDREIDRQVRAAKAVLVCWSPGAVESDWVRAESAIGRQRGVLAAALVKECDLPPPFNLVHADDLRAGIGPENQEWLNLLERIGVLVGRPGLAAYEAMGANPARAHLGEWIAMFPNDPLLETALARLRSMAD